MKTMIFSAAAAFKAQLAHHRLREPSSPAEPWSAAPAPALWLLLLML
jgi:hypothetical protein